MSTIILYDLPSRDPLHAWSLNPWKTRLALNYKKIQYMTMWIEYPEIAPTFKQVGIPPNKEGTPYTIPTIRFPSYTSSGAQWVMDSRHIATALEERFPSPSLHLDSPILAKVEALVPKITPAAMAPIIIPRVPRDILNEKSKYYFETTRAERFGMSLDELEKSEKGGENAWENAKPGFKELAELLCETEGPFFMGETVSYADFVVVGAFQFMKRAGEDIFDRVMKIDPSFPALYEACAAWLKRDDH